MSTSITLLVYLYNIGMKGDATRLAKLISKDNDNINIE